MNKCNNGNAQGRRAAGLVPFTVDDASTKHQHVVGFCRRDFAKSLGEKRFADCFQVSPNEVTLKDAIGKSSEERTEAVSKVLKVLRYISTLLLLLAQPFTWISKSLVHIFIITLFVVGPNQREEGSIVGWRDELYPVSSSFSEAPLFLMERAAAPYFGLKAYGVHVCAYVENARGVKKMWVARRSKTKQTSPSKLGRIRKR